MDWPQSGEKVVGGDTRPCSSSSCARGRPLEDGVLGRVFRCAAVARPVREARRSV